MWSQGHRSGGSRGSPRRRAGWIAAWIAAAALAGCAADEVKLIDIPDLPESPGVADKPWPKLVDAPSRAPEQGPDGTRESIQRGTAIEQGLSSEAEALRAADAEMRADPVLQSDLEREAARVRAEARAAATDG